MSALPPEHEHQPTPQQDADETMVCPVHPQREATLRCIRCDRPMCLACMVRTSVGYICKDCARQHDNQFFDANAVDYALAFTLPFVVSVAANALSLTLGFFLFALVIGFVGGGLVTTLHQQIKRRRKKGGYGRYSAQIAAVGTLAGALFAPTLVILLRAGALVFLPGAAIQFNTILCTFVMVSSVYALYRRSI